LAVSVAIALKSYRISKPQVELALQALAREAFWPTS
jgi:hypothetical protein